MYANQSDDSMTLQNYSVLNSDSFAVIVDQMARDMKFYAVFYIIYGVLLSLSVFGAILGVPMIIYSIRLKDAADQYREFVRTKDFKQLNSAFRNQKSYFFYNRIVIIIMLLLFLFYVIAIIMFGVSMFMSPPDKLLRT